MEEIEKLKVELERAKMTNYILEKENEILLGNLGMVCIDNKELLSYKKKLEKITSSFWYRSLSKIKRTVVRR